MPTYTYKAKNASAQTVTGSIYANNRDEAIEKITQKSLHPIIVEEGALKQGSSNQGVRRKIRKKDIYVLSRQLAGLIKAGIPILQALNMLAQQEKNETFRNVLQSLAQGVKDGRPLSECLGDHPVLFSPFYLSMIRVGEEGGNLKEVLKRLSEYQQRQEELSSKVRVAMAYPLLMFFAGIATVTFILTFVLPKITELFSNMSEELPLITKVVVGISEFIRGGWFWIVPLLLALVFILKKWHATQPGRRTVHQFQLRIPLVGEFILKAELARFANTLELLLSNGISIVKALNISIPIANNELIKEALAKAQQDLTEGGSLSASLKKSAVIPEMMANIIAVGEETGSLEVTLHEITETYEQETNEAIKTMTTLIEPIMILIVGGIVGAIVIAMLLPIFRIDVLAQ